MTPAEREPLSFDDAQILRLESDAIKGHTGKVLMIAPDSAGTPLRAETLRARVSERIDALPRLSQRIDLPADGEAAWVPAGQVDLDWHVSDPHPGQVFDEAGLRRLAGGILGERLDHERPLWRLDLIAMEDGWRALIGRFHHAMADGVTAIRIAAGLLADEPPGGGTATARPRSRPSPAGAPARPGRVRRLSRLPGTLRRELRPGADTALDRHIGSARQVAWTVIELERLKALGHRAGEGVTVNDAVLAVVAGGLRDWLGGHETLPASLRVQIPVCLHLHDGDASIGNRDSFLNVDLPLHEPDPLLRLRAINAETREAKTDHDAETLYAFFHALGRFRPLHSGVTRLISGPREFALSVSNVPGPPAAPVILGHPVDQFVSFAEPAERHALRIAVISAGERLAFGLCSDPEAVGELDRLALALDRAIEDLEAATAANGD